MQENNKKWKMNSNVIKNSGQRILRVCESKKKTRSRPTCVDSECGLKSQEGVWSGFTDRVKHWE